MPLTFPKAARLTRSSEFLRIKTEGRSYPGRYMVIGVLQGAPTGPGEHGPANKVGVITSRRLGGAVTRNRVRRRFRELLRLSQPLWQPGAWAVLIARHTAPKATYEELHREWLKLGRRSGFLRREGTCDAGAEKKEEASPGMG